MASIRPIALSTLYLRANVAYDGRDRQRHGDVS